MSEEKRIGSTLGIEELRKLPKKQADTVTIKKCCFVCKHLEITAVHEGALITGCTATNDWVEEYTLNCKSDFQLR